MIQIAIVDDIKSLTFFSYISTVDCETNVIITKIQIFANAHTYHINSISINSGCIFSYTVLGKNFIQKKQLSHFDGKVYHSTI